MSKQKPKQNVHVPVLVTEVLDYLNPSAGQSYLDLTAGYGGHAAEILERTNRPQAMVLVDRDEQAISALQQRFTGQGARIIHQDFLAASRDLAADGKRFDMILADLGTSSPHLENNDRGFSISNPGPLDMRMDASQALSAATIVNRWKEADLIRILREYGEEPKAVSIARNIIANRPIETTDQLADIAKKAWPGRSKMHPATRTFQALRIAVNDELAQLEQALPVWLELLAPGGRLAVISFHSLEDRLVKIALAENTAGGYDAEFLLLTKKPATASPDEIVSNPRARSAKLRAAAKIKTKRKEEGTLSDTH